MAAPFDYDVVVCGGGPVGLTLSILLSRLRIKHLLIERRPATSDVPRARGITHRTAEIWDRFGMTPDLAALTLPPLWMSRIVYQETLAGALVGAVPTPHNLPGAASDLTPADGYCISQDRTDALLREVAARSAFATLCFSTECTGVDADADEVSVELAGDGGRECVRAAWLVGCDGTNSSVRGLAGIGARTLLTMDTFINAHYDADLSRWTAGREAPLLWNMREGCEGVFGPVDGRKYWRCQINFDPAADPAASWTPAKIVARIQAMIGAPHGELPAIELRSFYPYVVQAGIADRFVHGRVLLAGDAAHQIPPHGAMGMNTGVQTAHNLAWKLAFVIRGDAPPALVTTFEEERREVALRVIEHAIGNYERMKRIREQSTPAQRRDAVGKARAYGNALGLDIGVHYERPGAFVPDGASPPAGDVTEYVPTAKPGYRAPHVWLDEAAGRSTIHLFDDAFVLLTGERGGRWRDAARTAPVEVRPYDAGALLAAPYEIEADGAVLVRPDGHVAFRSRSGAADPAAALNAALAQTLLRT